MMRIMMHRVLIESSLSPHCHPGQWPGLGVRAAADLALARAAGHGAPWDTETNAERGSTTKMGEMYRNERLDVS